MIALAILAVPPTVLLWSHGVWALAVVAALAWHQAGRAVIGRLALPALALELVLLVAARLADVLPCSVGCNGGAMYQTVAGIDNLWPALATYLVFALLALRDARRGAWCAWTVRLVWLLVGVSAFYVAVLVLLEMTCSFCLACHAGVLLAALVAAPIPAELRWWHLARWSLLGFLALNLVYHHEVMRDVATAEELAPTAGAVTAPAGADRSAVAAAEAHRSFGKADAPWRLEFVIDLHCPHCAAEHSSLWAGLKRQDGARLRVVTRHLVRRSDPSSSELARFALAAAAGSTVDYEAFLASVLGSREGAGFADLRGRIAEVLDTDALAKVEAAHHDDWQRLLAEDAAVLKRIKATGTTPQLILVEAATGVARKRWQGELKTDEVMAELAKLVTTDPPPAKPPAPAAP